MIKHFIYTKKSGDRSNRVVYPLHMVEDKVLAIDLSEFNDEQRIEAERILDKIHRDYLDEIYAAGFADNFRSFFLDGIE